MNLCTINGCEKPMKAKQLCMTHYQRLRRHGNPFANKQRKHFGQLCKNCGGQPTSRRDQCNPCFQKEYLSAYLQTEKGKEARRRSVRSWQKNNPDKVKARDANRRTLGNVPEDFELSDRCDWCGSNKNLSLEHWLPVCKGGTNDGENLGTLCRSCNSSKGGKTLLEWMVSRL